MFCGCDANIYGDEPNTHTCPTCLGLPGALPVPNYEAIEKTQLLGLALNCELNTHTYFDRKHYFYPDLPKGYQISQYKNPLCLGGYLNLESGKVAKLERIHLEEDTAKSFHEGGKTFIDYNKSGMPLVEIVTTPTFTDVKDAVDFCKQIQEIVRTLKIGNVDMEKGQMRLEANISMRTEEMEKSGELPSYKVEIKNINSFRFMEKAVEYEMKRQTELLEKGEKVLQENRGFNEVSGKTVSQREKEEAHDYRYFPEPDIPPMEFNSEHFAKLKHLLPELHYQKIERYVSLGVSKNTAASIASSTNLDIATKFEELIKNKDIEPKKAADLLVNKPEHREKTVEELLIVLRPAQDLIKDSQKLVEIITNILDNNPRAVEDFKKGKLNSVEFVLGQVMRETKGKAEVTMARELTNELIKKR